MIESDGRDFEGAVAALDTSVWDYIETETSQGDRRSLLACHLALARHGRFRYLEIGSHLGGSLQAMVRDRRCVEIISIDPRPASQPDERGHFSYDNNSTERMLELLGQVPGADLEKVHTFEAGTDILRPSELPQGVDMCFIDGEHTNEAALRDALFCQEVVDGSGLIVFHDSEVIATAITHFLRQLDVEAHAIALPTSVFAVELGGRRLLTDPAFAGALRSRLRLAAWRAASKAGCPAWAWTTQIAARRLRSRARRARDR
jgi:methyltransferase family protein